MDVMFINVSKRQSQSSNAVDINCLQPFLSHDQPHTIGDNKGVYVLIENEESEQRKHVCTFSI